MWFTLVYKRNGETNEALKEVCFYTRSEVTAQIDEIICTISNDDEPGSVFEPDGATPLNNGTDSREDGRTSLQRQKTGAYDGDNGSLEMKKTKLKECESAQCVEMRAKAIDRRMCLVTELQLANISEDVGNFWRELGPILRISAAKIQNLDEEYRCNRDKANSLLISWKQKEGKRATAGNLSDALECTGRKIIAERVLEMCDENLPTVINVGEGDEISLRVLDSKLGNKLMLCKDTQGNRYELKPLSESEEFLSSDLDEDVPVLVKGSRVAMETELKVRQNSLTLTRSGVQELSRQLKKVKFESDSEELCDKVQSSGERDDTKLKINHSSVDETSKVERVEQLLQWCEEQCSSYEGINDSLIKLISVVFGGMEEDKLKCITQFLEFTMELKDQENKIFSRIESVRSRSHHLDKHQVARVEQLGKWRSTQKELVDGVEKLLSFLLHQQPKTDQKSRRQQGLSECSGVDEKISEPRFVKRTNLMKTQKTFHKERKVKHES